MINILQLTSLKCGGAESVLINYYKTMDQNKVRFDFMVFSDTEEFYEEEVKKKGGIVYKADPTNRLKSGFSLLKYLSRKNKYDAIEIHTENSHSILWCIIAYIVGFKKVIVHSHSTNNVKAHEHEICKPLLNLLPIIRFSCGEDATRFMFGNRNAYVVNNAIDLRKFSYNKSVRDEIRNQLGVDDELVIGHVGRFIELKNQQLLIKVCDSLIKKGRKTKLVLIGDGELKETLSNLVKELKLGEHVIFTGNVTNVNEYLQGIDLFVLPSYYEGFPTVAVEAQAAGLRCLLSETITRKINLTGETYFYSIERNENEWANEIIRISDYDRVNTTSIIIEKGFDVNMEVHKLEKIYEIIGENKNDKIKEIYLNNHFN